MLLLPGLSMIAGGIKYKEQKFNPVAAGVSSILLFIAVVGAFTPTIFYHAFGQSSEQCGSCVVDFVSNSTIGKIVCSGCKFDQSDLLHDPLFMQGARYVTP
jgi:Ca2+:H+ antiporter